jgi:hypothetical protein
MLIAAKRGNNSVDIFFGNLKLIVFKNLSSRGLRMIRIKDADIHSHFGWIHVPRVELPLLIHVLIVYLLSLLLEGQWNLFFLFFYFRFRGGGAAPLPSLLGPHIASLWGPPKVYLW